MNTLPLKPWYRIGEVCRWLGEEAHVVRYWESEFAWYVRTERAKSGQRIYNRKQLAALAVIKELLRVELYTIAGAKRQLRLAAEREREAG